MIKLSLKMVYQGLAVAGVAMALSGLGWSSGALQGLEAKTWDIRSRLLARPSAFTADIVQVLLDQQSIDWVHESLGISWPWPRELHGAIVSQCRRRGALVVGIDVLFTEPSFFGVSDDQVFGQALGQMEGLAIGSVSAPSASGRFLKWPDFAPRPQFVQDSSKLSPKAHRALFPIPEVAGHGLLCNVNQQADDDGIFRRFKPLIFF